MDVWGFLHFGLLALLPILEIYFLYLMKVHAFIFRAMKQYYDLNQDERQFILLGFQQEIVVIAIAAVAAYILALWMDHITHAIVPNSVMPIFTFILTIIFCPNSFENKHERRYMRRLEGVIIQMYTLLAPFVLASIAVIFDVQFMEYLPFPSLFYLDLQSTSENLLPFPKWFTLSIFLVYLPTSVYTAILFYLANFCFLLWGRAFYYGYQKRLWWSVEDNERALEYFIDLDSG